MNLIERFFADLTEDVIRTGSFGSVVELVRDIKAYLVERNAKPRPSHEGGRSLQSWPKRAPRRPRQDQSRMIVGRQLRVRTLALWSPIRLIMY